MEKNPTPGADQPEMLDTGDVQPSPRPPFIEADRDHDVEDLDDVAGSEFVDDRIRRRE